MKATKLALSFVWNLVLLVACVYGTGHSAPHNFATWAVAIISTLCAIVIVIRIDRLLRK